MKELIKSISQKEWRFIILMALAMIMITSLPYLYAFFMAPAGYVYDGIGSLTPADNPVYYSYLNQVKTGHIFLLDYFTGEKQTQGMFNIFWLVAGLAAKIFQWPVIFAFHFFRLALIPVFIFVAYLFISLFFKEFYGRKLSLIFLLFSAGLGAYFYFPLALFDLSSKPGYWTPNDIWIPESITFLTLYKTPHFIASLILLLVIFILMIFAFTRRKAAYSAAAGLVALVYFNFHPFYIPMVYGALGLYLLLMSLRQSKIPWPQVGHYLILILLSCPAAVYHFWILAANDVIRQRALQNVTLAPPFIFLLIGYGLLWPLAIIGLLALAKKGKFNEPQLFLASWLCFSLILVILPSQFQSRYTQGLHLPLVIFSVFGWQALKAWFLSKEKGKNFHFLVYDKTLLTLFFIIFLAISNIFNLLRDLSYFTYRPGLTFDYFYVSRDSLNAIQSFIAKNEDRVYLGQQMTSLFIPALSNSYVYSAHPIETLDYYAKFPYVNWFFSSDGQNEKKYQFLKKNKIDYVFFGELEKKLGSFNPATKSFLKEVYRLGQVQIYQVL